MKPVHSRINHVSRSSRCVVVSVFIISTNTMMIFT